MTLGEQDLLNTALEKHEIDQNARFEQDQVIESKEQQDITKRDTTELIDSTGRKIIIREPIIPIDLKESASEKELSRDEVIKAPNVPTIKNESRGNSFLWSVDNKLFAHSPDPIITFCMINGSKMCDISFIS